MRLRWPLIGALALICLLVWLWRSASEPVEPTPAPSRKPAPNVAPAPVPSIAPPKQRLTVDRAHIKFDASTHHTADPCSPILEPEIPSGFEQITEGPITVAWNPGPTVGPYDAPLRPVSLAHAALGVLEEAAQLTGTDRRQQLTVIVDTTAEDLSTRTHLPSWVGGLYDGGAVYVPWKPNGDLGVSIQTLRHEILHAQVHAGIGCVPFWFNEGLANYFAGELNIREWFAMLRSGDSFDLATVRDPYIFDLMQPNVSRLYAVSLAMIVYLVHHGDDRALRIAVAQVRAMEHPLDMWEQVAPQVGYREVLDSLGQAIFKTDVEGGLRGAACCYNLRSPAELACRAAAAGETGYVGKHELCRRW